MKTAHRQGSREAGKQGGREAGGEAEKKTCIQRANTNKDKILSVLLKAASSTQ